MKNRNFDKLKVEFTKIAKFNSRETPNEYHFVFDNGSVVDDENNNRRYIFSMLMNKTITFNLFVAILIFWAISFSSNLLSFHSKYFKANGYDMAFLMMHADIFGTIIAVLLRTYHLSTKTLLIISFAVSAVFTIPLLYIPEVDWTTMISVVGCQFGISMWFYLSILNVSETFPPLFVAFAFFVWNFSASLVNIISPLIAEATHPTPMRLLFSVSMGLSLLWVISFNIKALNNLKSQNGHEESENSDYGSKKYD